MASRRISTRNLASDDHGIIFDVDVDGRSIRTRISYHRLLDRPATQADRALPPKFLFENKRDLVQSLIDARPEIGRSGDSDYLID